MKPAESSNTISRRQMLKASALTVGATALAACGQAPAPGTDQTAAAPAAPAIKNMNLSLAAYSLRDELSVGKLDMFGFIDYCAELNIPGAELTSYYFKEGFDKAYLHELKRHAHRAGIVISGTAIGNDFCLPKPEEREAEVAKVKQWIDNAAEFYAPHIRIFAGRLKDGMDKQQMIIQVADCIKKSLDYAAERGVFLGLENHGGITEFVEDHLAICDAVGQHPWFGINLDGGNYHKDAWESLARAARISVNVQIKVYMYDNEGKAFPVDIPRFGQLLVDAGYKGWVALEYEAEEDPRTAIPRWIAEMKKVFTGKA